MRNETIRAIDVFVGRPICFALTLWRRVTDVVRRSPPPPRKILFLKLIEQGSTVPAHAAIARAVERVGRENVWFMVFEENRAILDILDVIPRENVIAIRRSSFLRFALGCLGALARARRIGIDAVVDMELFARASAILAFLSGARRRVGLHRFTSEAPYRGDLMTHRVQASTSMHIGAQYRLMVDALFTDAAEEPLLKRPAREFAVREAPAFRASDDERARVAALVARELGAKPAGPLVLLNPNASDLLPLRKWPTERFVELGKRVLAEIDGATVAITGAPSERESAELVAKSIASPRAISVAGKTTLRELLALYSLADVLVTNDSGPGHFSAMTEIDAIVMFGPETPVLFGPLGPRVHVLWAELACSPCVSAINHRFSPCTNNVCMQAISVGDVLAKIRDVLALRRARREGVSTTA